MQTMRDVLGAWLIVGALGLAVVAIWGSGAPDIAGGQTVACADGVTQDSVATLHGVDVPHGGWRPSAELTGVMPAADGRPASYEVAEERNLQAIGATGDEAAQMAHGSMTSLNPPSIC